MQIETQSNTLTSANNSPHVLMLESSRLTQVIFGQSLTQRGYQVSFCQSVPEAMSRLQKNSYQCLLISMDLPDITGLDFTLWLKNAHPEIPVIMLLEHPDNDVYDMLRQEDIAFFNVAWQIDTLITLLESNLRKRGLDLTVQEISLFELLQLCVMSGRQRCLQIIEPVSQKEGLIWFGANRISHVKMGDVVGDNALLEIMKLDKGRFQEVAWIQFEKESIVLPFDALMMNLTTRLDESSHDSAQSKLDLSGKVPRLNIVASDELFAKQLQSHFEKIGFQTNFDQNPDLALHRAIQSPPELLIFNLTKDEMPVETFLEKLYEKSPQTRTIIVVEEHDLQIVQIAKKWGLTTVCFNPVEIPQLESLARYLLAQQSFSGKLQNLSLLDILQIVSGSQQVKQFRIHDFNLETQGILTFEKGNVLFAELDQVSGEDAFQAMLQIERGFLSEITPEQNPPSNLDLPITRLLMRAMAKIELPVIQSEDSVSPLPYHASQLFHGKNLRDLIDKQAKFKLEDCLLIFMRCAAALEQAHRQGIVYQELRPEYFGLLPNQQIMISNVLNSKVVNSQDPQVLKDKLAYLAPEQLYLQGRSSLLSDIFSFGVIMYQFFTHELPFQSLDTTLSMLKLLGEPLISPLEINPALPPKLVDIIVKCLEKEPEKRYANARLIVEDLMLCLQESHASDQDISISKSKSKRQTSLINLRRRTGIIQLTPTRLKILHVEDDPLRKKIFTDLLESSDLDADCVQSDTIAETQQLLSRQKFDFIVCDYILKDGTSESLLELAQGTPLVVVSTLNQPEVIIRLMKKGALDFIIKSNAEYEFVQIRGLIQQQIKKRKQQTKLEALSGLALAMASEESDVSAAIEQAQATAQATSQKTVLTTADGKSPVITFEKVIGGPGNLAVQFASPRWIHYCHFHQQLLIADTQNQRIQILSPNGDFIQFIQHPELQSPCSVTRNRDGNIFVLDAADSRLRMFSAEGQLEQTFGGQSQIKSVFGMILLQNQDLLISDAQGASFHILSPEGELKKTFSHDNKSPSGMYVYKDQIFVVDFSLPAVCVLDQQGQEVQRFGKRGIKPGEFSVPKGICVSNQGHIFISESLSHRLQIFDQQGQFLTSFGKKGTGAGEFSNPESLAYRPDAGVYILDRGNHRIQYFSIS